MKKLIFLIAALIASPAIAQEKSVLVENLKIEEFKVVKLPAWRVKRLARLANRQELRKKEILVEIK